MFFQALTRLSAALHSPATEWYVSPPICSSSRRAGEEPTFDNDAVSASFSSRAPITTMEIDVRTSIVSSYNLCIQSFDRLRRILERPDCEYANEFSPSELKEQEGRFRIWAGNSGAHRTGRVSLDYKLREASHVHEKVIDLLGDLNSALHEAISITANENRYANDSSTDSSSSNGSESSSSTSGSTAPAEDLPTTTELEYTLLDITHVITCLYKFSIALRQPAPKDRLHKYAAINVSHFEIFDIGHAREKFPGAARFLIERLGRANTRRRQLLKYHQRHHDKIARYVDLPLAPEIPELGVDVADEDEASKAVDTEVNLVDPKTFALSKPGPATLATTMNTQTTVTTVKFAPKNLDDIEAESDTGQSQTSFATSTSGDADWKIRVPPPPNAGESLEGNPFECPYCFTMIVVHSSRSWMRHVMKDLKAYVCTFEYCAKPDQLFEFRHEWYEHEIQAHRREWICEDCHEIFHNKKEMHTHLQSTHSDLFAEHQIPVVINQCERASTSEQPCPICTEVMSPQRLRGHLARHLQQLALFVLPRNSGAAQDEAHSVGAQASIESEDDISGSSHSTKENLEFNSNPSRSSSDVEEALQYDKNEESKTRIPTLDVSAEDVVTDTKIQTVDDATAEHEVYTFFNGLNSPEDENLLQAHRYACGLAKLASIWPANTNEPPTKTPSDNDIFLNIRKTFLDIPPSKTAETKEELFAYLGAWARFLSNNGRAAEAIDLYDRIIDDFDADNDLANPLINEKILTADKSWEAILESRVRKPFDAARSIAKLYDDSGQYDKAIARYEWLLDHITGTSVMPFGAWEEVVEEMVAVYRRKDPEGTKRDCLRVYETLLREAARRYNLDQHNRSVLLCQERLARQLRICGEFEKAVELYRSTLETRKSINASNGSIIRDLEELAELHVEMSIAHPENSEASLSQAVKLYRDALALTQNSGERSESAMKVMSGLARVLQKQSSPGSLAEAIELRRSIFIARGMLGHRDPRNIQALDDLTTAMEIRPFRHSSPHLSSIYSEILRLHKAFSITVDILILDSGERKYWVSKDEWGGRVFPGVPDSHRSRGLDLETNFIEPLDVYESEMAYRQITSDHIQNRGISHPDTLRLFPILLRLLAFKAFHFVTSISQPYITKLYDDAITIFIDVLGKDDSVTKHIQEDYMSWCEQVGDNFQALKIRSELVAQTTDPFQFGELLDKIEEYTKTEESSKHTEFLLDQLKMLYSNLASLLGPGDPRPLQAQVVRGDVFCKAGNYNSALDTYIMAFNGFNLNLITGDGSEFTKLGSSRTFGVIKAIAELRPHCNPEKWKATLRHIIEAYDRYQVRFRSDAVDMVLGIAALFDDTNQSELESELGWYRACLEAFEDFYIESSPSKTPEIPTDQGFVHIFNNLSSRQLSTPMLHLHPSSPPNNHIKVLTLKTSILGAIERKKAFQNAPSTWKWILLQSALGFQNAWNAFYRLETELWEPSAPKAAIAYELYQYVKKHRVTFAWTPTDYLPAVSVITGIAVVMERQSLYSAAVDMWRNAYAIVREIGASKEWARMAAYLGRMADISASVYEERNTQNKDRDLTNPQSRAIQVLEWYAAKLEFLESYGSNNPDTSIHLPVNQERVRTLASITMFYIKIGEVDAGIKCYSSAFETKTVSTKIDRFALRMQDEQIDILKSKGNYTAALAWCDATIQFLDPGHPVIPRYLEKAGDISVFVLKAREALERYESAFETLEHLNDTSDEMDIALSRARIAQKIVDVHAQAGRYAKVGEWYMKALDVMENCRHLGSTHEETLGVMSRAADAMQERGRWQNAITMRERILDGLRARGEGEGEKARLEEEKITSAKRRMVAQVVGSRITSPGIAGAFRRTMQG